MEQTLLTANVTDRIIQMAWEDRTPFDAIESQFGLTEKDVIQLMRRELKRSSFERWRKRVHGRATKHLALRDGSVWMTGAVLPVDGGMASIRML